MNDTMHAAREDQSTPGASFTAANSLMRWLDTFLLLARVLIAVGIISAMAKNHPFLCLQRVPLSRSLVCDDRACLSMRHGRLLVVRYIDRHVEMPV